MEAKQIESMAINGRNPLLLAQLKPAQADAVRLVKLQGLSVAEAARATGQSIPLVKVNAHRGLARLARLVMGS